MSGLVLAFLPMLMPTEWLEKYLPERNRDTTMIVMICSVIIVGGLGFYIAFPEMLPGPERKIQCTADETIVVIGGGYGVGSVIAERFQKYLFNVAIVDLRDTDGKEFAAESKKMKKARDKSIIREKKARERALARARAKGEPIDEGEEQEQMDPKNLRVYKCDPSSVEDLEAVRTKIEVDLGHPTILIWAYTPYLQDATKVFASFSASLSVFLPALKTADNGGMFITLISSLAHIQPGPKHLRQLAREYRDTMMLHRATAKALKREKRYDIKDVLVELGHFDDRAIDVGLYFDDKLRLLEKRAVQQREEDQKEGREDRMTLQVKTKAELEALTALRRRRTRGFLVRTTPDHDIAKTVFKAVEKGQNEVIYMPQSCGICEYIGKLPRCINKWMYRALGIPRTVQGLSDEDLMGEERIEWLKAKAEAEAKAKAEEEARAKEEAEAKAQEQAEAKAETKTLATGAQGEVEMEGAN